MNQRGGKIKRKYQDKRDSQTRRQKKEFRTADKKPSSLPRGQDQRKASEAGVAVP